MSKLDPRLFDKEANIKALMKAFEKEPSKRYGGWLSSNHGQFLPNIKHIPRGGFKSDDLVDPETGLPKGNAVFGMVMLPLLEDYYKVLDTGDYELLDSLFKRGFPINFISPFTGSPTIHALASTCSRKALEVLFAQPGVDYLIRDRVGRLASECAFVLGDDVELAEILSAKEKEQADRNGVRLKRRE